jgi:ABC-type nitrate/sulfonate/bicarbonate transport system permease component
MNAGATTSSRSVANEIKAEVKERKPFSLVDLLTNQWFLYAVSLAGFFTIWETLVAQQVFGKGLPSFVDVFLYLGTLIQDPLAGQNLFGHTWASTRRILIGFAIAAAIAVPLGLFMALNKHVNAVVKPLFDLVKPMPPISWISISILWFGIDEASKVFIIIIGTFVPCLLNAYEGVRLVDPQAYDVIRMLGGRRRDEIIQVCFPASFPAIFAGLQISLSIAWTCVLAAELVSSRSGLGFIIIQGMTLSRPAMTVAGMVAIALAAMGTSFLVTALEKWLCPWRRDIKNI